MRSTTWSPSSEPVDRGHREPPSAEQSAELPDLDAEAASGGWPSGWATGSRTRPSCTRPCRTGAGAREREGQPSNERLEFLGDAVLGLVVAEHCYARLPRVRRGPAGQGPLGRGQRPGAGRGGRGPRCGPGAPARQGRGGLGRPGQGVASGRRHRGADRRGLPRRRVGGGRAARAAAARRAHRRARRPSPTTSTTRAGSRRRPSAAARASPSTRSRARARPRPPLPGPVFVAGERLRARARGRSKKDAEQAAARRARWRGLGDA